MLEKQRNFLIKKAFVTAKIVTSEGELTETEIDDAAYTLNCMLQEWSNDGFRLFNIKTGYMPFKAKVNEYKLSTEAYKDFNVSKAISFETIGFDRIKVKSIANMGEGQKIIFANNLFSEANEISKIDYENGIVFLKKPINISVYSGDSVFFGRPSFASTEVKTFESGFSSILFDDYTTAPSVGDSLLINYNNSWTSVVVKKINVFTKEVSFSPSLPAGNITKNYIVYGSSLWTTTLSDNAELSTRKINVDSLPFFPTTVSLKTNDGMNESMLVEGFGKDYIVVEKPLSDSALELMGKKFVEAEEKYKESTELEWYEIPSSLTGFVEDWGKVTGEAVETDNWGFVTQSASEKIDFGSLVGDTKITSFAKSDEGIYVSVNSEEKGVLLYRTGSDWEVIKEEKNIKLFTFNGSIYAYNCAGGLFLLSEKNTTSVFSQFDVEYIIGFKNLWYLVSKKQESGVRAVVSTENFSVFSSSWTIKLDSLQHPAEFKGKLYVGSPETFVTADMKNFFSINVYSEGRAVVGDSLMNLNSSFVCSYTKDGVNFYPMPMTLTNQTAWTNPYGCSFISVYGVKTESGKIGSQVFSSNNFGDTWFPQTVIEGKVSSMYESEDMLYIVSDVQVKSLKLLVDFKAEDSYVYLFGEQIGRPQEIMNVVKYSVDNKTQLSMQEMALKDYSQLPHIKADGDPVSYCFFRDAKDGLMMIWGTPKKFGEYLKFSYVEPIALLDNARSTPDIPDEYISSVIDGLAAKLAYDYSAPLERVQLLENKAMASKELAMLHDNEMASYSISPEIRE